MAKKAVDPIWQSYYDQTEVGITSISEKINKSLI